MKYRQMDDGEDFTMDGFFNNVVLWIKRSVLWLVIIFVIISFSLFIKIVKF